MADRMRGFRYFLVSIFCFLLNVGFIAMAKLTLLVTAAAFSNPGRPRNSQASRS